MTPRRPRARCGVTAPTITFQYRKGKHNWSFGGGYTHYLNNTIRDANGRGTFSSRGFRRRHIRQRASGAGTGYDFADFLLGLPETSSISYGNSSTSYRSNGYNAFAMDDWRVATDFTLNLGLRYEYFTPWSEEYGHIANLDIAPDFASVTPVCPVAITLNGVTWAPDRGRHDVSGGADQSGSSRFRAAHRVSPGSRGPAARSWFAPAMAAITIPTSTTSSNQNLAAQPPFAVTNYITTSSGRPVDARERPGERAGRINRSPILTGWR